MTETQKKIALMSKNQRKNELALKKMEGALAKQALVLKRKNEQTG